MKRLNEQGVTLILRQLHRRFGLLDNSLRSQIAALPLPLLEDRSEALLDFSASTDVTHWLQAHQP